MGKFFGLMLCLGVAVIMVAELRDWLWWYHWENHDDERNPAPLLSATRRAWEVVIDVSWRIWTRFIWPIQSWLKDKLAGLSPPKDSSPPGAEDGRSVDEWFAIEAIGIWNLECWYKDEYDWQVKRNWDEFLGSQDYNRLDAPV